jgi:hypothetical protein
MLPSHFAHRDTAMNDDSSSPSPGEARSPVSSWTGVNVTGGDGAVHSDDVSCLH